MKTWADFNITITSGAAGEIYTTCPECSPRRRKANAKCLSVNVEKEVWHCHHCGWSGTLKSGAERRSNNKRWKDPNVWVRPKEAQIGALPDTAIDWFAKRGISQAVLERNKVSFGRVWMPQMEDWVEAICFPYFRAEELINRKWRDGRKNFRMEADAERVLYGLNDLGTTTIIVEGEIDKLSLEVAGFKNCVSVPDGAPDPKTKNYDQKFTFLQAEGDAKRLAQVQRFVIAVDNDGPGLRLEEELVRRLGRAKCSRVRWPVHCKDANDVLREHGAQVLKECVEQAEPYPVEGLYSFGSLATGIQTLWEGSNGAGVTTGWRALDNFFTVRPGEMILVTGIPSHGKSTWLDNLVLNLLRLHGWNTALCSPESQPLEEHAALLIEKYARAPFFPDIGRMTLEQRDEIIGWLSDRIIFILGEDGMSLDWILERGKDAVYRYGIKVLVMDPWNEIEHVVPPGLNETQYVSLALSKIRRFARDNGVAVFIVAHPTKLIKGKNGAYPVPTPYDVSGSANWRNKPDVCIAVYRDAYTKDPSQEGVVQIHIQKVRRKRVGRIGMAELDFDAITGTYADKVRIMGGQQQPLSA